MEKRVKDFIKLFIKNKGLLRAAGNLYENLKYYLGYFISYPLERVKYHYCLASGRPYFGAVLQAAQTNPRRAHWMALAAGLFRDSGRPLRVLEIGSWAGGSALVWAGAVAANPSGGSVVCVDPWKNYFSLSKNRSWKFTYRQMEAALRSGDIVRLFFHNISASGHSDRVIAMRAPSSAALPLLEAGSFDVIYIDGDHSYSGVLADLNLSGRLLRDGGVICGDDMELQFNQVDQPRCREFRENDYIVDFTQNTSYHPGVALAVWEYFGGEVESADGFWVMKRSGGSWVKPGL